MIGMHVGNKNFAVCRILGLNIKRSPRYRRHIQIVLADAHIEITQHADFKRVVINIIANVKIPAATDAFHGQTKSPALPKAGEIHIPHVGSGQIMLTLPLCLHPKGNRTDDLRCSGFDIIYMHFIAGKSGIIAAAAVTEKLI